MTNQFSYIVTARGITAVIHGETHTITSDNASYQEVVKAITRRVSPSIIADLFRTANAVKRYSKGLIEVAADGSSLFYKGEPVNNVVVDRILLFMQQGLPVDPLLRFLERLLANPSKTSVDALYTFLENGEMPITEDGFFLGYKGLNENYTDCHTGKVDNRIGQKPRMLRRLVNDDTREDCSYGFHVGTLTYATGFGRRTVIVKVDPADVVSVPSSNLTWKLRTCAYEVVADYNGSLGNTYADSKSPYAKAGFTPVAPAYRSRFAPRPTFHW